MTAAHAARVLVALGAVAIGALGIGATVAARRAAPRAGVASRDTAAFLDSARAGTRRYASQQAAVDDGFTRVGAEFPAMGEHWVSYARAMEGDLRADRPSLLIYVNGTDGPRLAGVAYTSVVAPAGRAPNFPRPGAWHEHNGALGEESLPASHTAHARPDGEAGAARVFVLHAWVWTPNPDGAFATDNWSLPFARRGVAAPAAGPRTRDAARALALADDRDGYHVATLRSALAPAAGDAALVARAVARHQALAGRAVRSPRTDGRLTPADADRLAAAWDALWADLEAALPARAAELRRLRQVM